MRAVKAKALRKFARQVSKGLPERCPRFVKTRDVPLPVEGTYNGNNPPKASRKCYIIDANGFNNRGTTRGVYREMKKNPERAFEQIRSLANG